MAKTSEKAAAKVSFDPEELAYMLQTRLNDPYQQNMDPKAGGDYHSTSTVDTMAKRGADYAASRDIEQRQNLAAMKKSLNDANADIASRLAFVKRNEDMLKKGYENQPALDKAAEYAGRLLNRSSTDIKSAARGIDQAISGGMIGNVLNPKKEKDIPTLLAELNAANIPDQQREQIKAVLVGPYIKRKKMEQEQQVAAALPESFKRVDEISRQINEVQDARKWSPADLVNQIMVLQQAPLTDDQYNAALLELGEKNDERMRAYMQSYEPRPVVLPTMTLRDPSVALQLPSASTRRR